MGLWKERAPEIQSLLDSNKTLAEIAAHFGVSRKSIRNRIAELRAAGVITGAEPDNYRASLDIGKDGAYTSDKPLWMTLEQVKDPEYLLRAHGFEPDAWELVSAKNNIWNTNDKVHGIQTLYASKITVKPRVQTWTFDDLLTAIKSDVKPVHIRARTIGRETDRMLEISLFDMHFGNNDLQHYQDTQQEIIDLLSAKRWREVIFVIGQDLLHHDNFKSSTANGTIIANADMPKAVEDAKAFYYPLIELAGEQTNCNVKVIYSKGNHDESMSYMFVQVLKERYPQLRFDDAVKERKVHVYGRNFVGFTHGDKMPRKEITRLFPQEFPIEWSQTTFREVHAGDLHREDLVGKDEWGVMFRTLSTANQTDQWHEDKGFTTAHKRFMLFEYSPERLKHIHYV